MTKEKNVMAETEDDRYLVFKVGAETLATPLLSVREIVEPLPYRVVPNPHNYYLGLANLRGQIVGVIDMGVRLGFEAIAGKTGGAFLVFEVEGMCMAAFVSCVESVSLISHSMIAKGGQAEMRIPPQALLGIAQTRERLVPIVELPSLLDKSMQIAG